MASIEGSILSLRRRTVLAAAVAVVGLAGAACAFAGPDPVDLKVVDRETGRVLPVWRHAGRLFIAGQPGARYSLRVTNRTGGRVEVVMSVDGVNIVTGETASYDQTGYVLRAHESYDVSGWRKSDTEVAAFSFAPLPQSYAARTGRPGDVGVIGMAVFKERRAPEPEPPVFEPQWREGEARGSSSNAAGARQAVPPPAGFAAPPPAPAAVPPAAAMAAPQSDTETVTAERREEKLGTAHGAREWSEVGHTEFVRSTSYPVSTRQIEYDTYDNLVAAGVIPRGWDEGHRPRPFPSQPDGAGYVPDPPDDP